MSSQVGELNQSGRPPGCDQHVEFNLEEIMPVTELDLLDASPATKIHRVRYKRINLARKLMRCGSRL